MADVRDIPSSYAGGCYRTDALGESLCILRLPAGHALGKHLSEGEVVVLVTSSLAGVDPSRDLDRATNPRRNPNAVRWHSQEINQMVFVWSAQRTIASHRIARDTHTSTRIAASMQACAGTQ